MNSGLNLLYRCNHHQKPFTCFQRFSSSQLRWVISRSLKCMQHCTVIYQIQTRCQLFHCQGIIQQYHIFNCIEDGLFSASFCTTVIMNQSINIFVRNRVQKRKKKKYITISNIKNIMNAQNTTIQHFLLNSYWGWQDYTYQLCDS